MQTRSIFRGLTFALCVLALPASVSAAEGFARRSGVLRAGAGTDYPSITRVSKGTSLEVYGCTRRYSWCDVDAEGERGWFPGARIDFAQDGRRIPLSEGAAAIGLSILSFGMADYWSSHYSDRSFYGERRWWRGHGATPPPQGGSFVHVPRPPVVQAPPAAVRQRPPGVHATPPGAGHDSTGRVPRGQVEQSIRRGQNHGPIGDVPGRSRAPDRRPGGGAPVLPSSDIGR
ncbi:SH3 domain-containing protein [Pinisolibacter aquiterrae]|uniref:SH3 domain-containing protein n=1 Tax=Pinisolibacter aquiterrae TaxID=2815579 RepID=UPI001C3C9636|nr:SH3 domain-containing protein [Pinisolibacter aquiterrae]MBV5262505.1 SH3 domain-containing protein [Pinisolibacter aquiterrae]MCC8235860.1 SH3 domain-containing protein [Pinisolibacter aquiterrae]